MRRLFLLSFLVLAACSESSAPKPAADPPAALHIINRSGRLFDGVELIIGVDMLHSGVRVMGEAEPDTTRPDCAFSGQVPGERVFIEIAVEPRSSLDSLLHMMTNGDSRCSSCRPPATEAVLDSLARGTLSLEQFLRRTAGLIAATQPYDPAPAGWPADETVPWTWIVDGPGQTTIAIDTLDYTCRPR